MNEYVNKILLLDQEIRDFIRDNSLLSADEFDKSFEEKKFIKRAKSLLNKLSNIDLIEVIKRSEYIWSFIDLGYYIKKYPLNKDYLKENKDKYIDEYKSLQKLCMHISELSNDYNEFDSYLKKLNIDKVEEYLLQNMPNEQIYELSQETDDWVQKLFYFSFLKKDKKTQN